MCEGRDASLYMRFVATTPSDSKALFLPDCQFLSHLGKLLLATATLILCPGMNR